MAKKRFHDLIANERHNMLLVSARVHPYLKMILVYINNMKCVLKNQCVIYDYITARNPN